MCRNDHALKKFKITQISSILIKKKNDTFDLEKKDKNTKKKIVRTLNLKTSVNGTDNWTSSRLLVNGVMAFKKN